VCAGEVGSGSFPTKLPTLWRLQQHRIIVLVLLLSLLIWGRRRDAVCLFVCVCVCVFVAIVRGERTGVLISCLLAVLSVGAEEGVWGGEGGRGT
jgi:MFS superfamily sulfate permease-like transporter